MTPAPRTLEGVTARTVAALLAGVRPHDVDPDVVARAAGLSLVEALAGLEELHARGIGRWWIVRRDRAGYEIARYPSAAHLPWWAAWRRAEVVFSPRYDRLSPATSSPTA